MKLIEETKLYVEVEDISQAAAALEAVKEQAAGRRVHIRIARPSMLRLHEQMAVASADRHD